MLLQAVEAEHHVIELAVLCLFLLLGVAVEHSELVLELCLHATLGGTRLVLPLSVDGNEVGQSGSLVALPDLDHDAHDHILEAVLSEDLVLLDTLHLLGQSGDIVTWELPLLLQYLVLIDQQVPTEWLVLIFLDQFFHLLVRELQ